MEDKSIKDLLERERRRHLSGSVAQKAVPLSQEQLQPLTSPPPVIANVFSDLRNEYALAQAIVARIWSINFAIEHTVTSSRASILAAVDEMEGWIINAEIVRVIGAGRALLAAAIPSNRLAHAGARVYIQHDVVPLPPTWKGGAILAASASGKTESVLQSMRTAKRRNPKLRIIGIADKTAEEFQGLCDIFVGINQTDNPYPNPLRALADMGEYIISELLDAMVVAAARRAGLTEENFREGHEDLGDTGPYLPKGKS